MPTILVLGCNGFIGTHLVTALVADGCTVIGVDHSTVSSRLTEIPRFTFIQGRVEDAQLYQSIFHQCVIDIVIPLVCTVVPGSSNQQFVKDLPTNMGSFIRLIEHMKQHQVKKLVFLSSGGTVYGENGTTTQKESSPLNPTNAYGWLKVSQEAYLKLQHQQSGIDYLILRPSNAYGPGQTGKNNQGIIAAAMSSILEHIPLEIWGDGTTKRDFIYVEDLVRGVVQLIKLDQWNEIVNIASGSTVDLNTTLTMVENVIQQPLERTYLPSRGVDSPVTQLDITKLRGLVNWDNLTPLETGIQRMWQWWRQS